MPATIILTRLRKRAHAFRLRSAGRILLTSPTFVFKVSCQYAIDILREVSRDMKNFETSKSTNGEFFFVLRDDTGQLLATSAMFAGADECQRAINTVRQEAKYATLIDRAHVT